MKLLPIVVSAFLLLAFVMLDAKKPSNKVYKPEDQSYITSDNPEIKPEDFINQLKENYIMTIGEEECIKQCVGK